MQGIATIEGFSSPTLSADDVAKIKSSLSAFGGQEYKITTFWDSREPMAFANMIHRVLAQAQWVYLKHGEGGSFLIGVIDGVEIYVHPEASEKAKLAAEALTSALEDAGQLVKLKSSGGPSQSVISLNIGTKP